MRYTKLGRTGLDASVIGTGMEHLRGQPRKTVVSVVREAIERGVNYVGCHQGSAEGVRWPAGACLSLHCM